MLGATFCGSGSTRDQASAAPLASAICKHGLPQPHLACRASRAAGCAAPRWLSGFRSPGTRVGRRRPALASPRPLAGPRMPTGWGQGDCRTPPSASAAPSWRYAQATRAGLGRWLRHLGPATCMAPSTGRGSCTGSLGASRCVAGPGIAGLPPGSGCRQSRDSSLGAGA